ncbi:MAG TPA: S-layer protein [Methanoregula sp.]|nr:S-layer protein [Methanoregula sp.]
MAETSKKPLPGYGRGASRAGRRRPDQCTGILRLLCAASFILILVALSPVMADSKYMTGTPDLNAHISGTNEFSPGDDIYLPVVIENTGLNQFKIVESGIIDANDLSSTAKQLTVTLDPSDAPIVIKADPQVVGDLPGSGTATAMFHITVSQDAPAGTYQIPVTMDYTYLYRQNQEGETLAYEYKDASETLLVPMKIKSVLQLALSGVDTENLVAGNEGYVDLTVQNVGYEDGRNAAIIVRQDNQSPFTPTEGSEYIGDFPRGAAVNARFRVLVSGNALQKTYPLTVMVNYKNAEGDYVNSEPETIGVPVGGKVQFSVTPVSASVLPGEKSVVVVQYQNTGGATAYNAQARITAVDPFTTDDDTAFLGTMAPGDIRRAAFDISVANGATAKAYGVDSVVIYQDSLDNQVTSDHVNVNVQIIPAPGIVSLIVIPVIIVIALAAVALIARRIYTKWFRAR